MVLTWSCSSLPMPNPFSSVWNITGSPALQCFKHVLDTYITPREKKTTSFKLKENVWNIFFLNTTRISSVLLSNYYYSTSRFPNYVFTFIKVQKVTFSKFMQTISHTWYPRGGGRKVPRMDRETGLEVISNPSVRKVQWNIRNIMNSTFSPTEPVAIMRDSVKPCFLGHSGSRYWKILGNHINVKSSLSWFWFKPPPPSKKV